MAETSQDPCELPPPAMKAAGNSSDLSTAAMVLGIAGLIPLLGVLPALLGVVFGATSLITRRPGKRRAAVGLVSGAVLLFVWVSFLTPAIRHQIEDAEDSRCYSNLSAIAKSMAMYKCAATHTRRTWNPW